MLEHNVHQVVLEAHILVDKGQRHELGHGVVLVQQTVHVGLELGVLGRPEQQAALLQRAALARHRQEVAHVGGGEVGAGGLAGEQRDGVRQREVAGRLRGQAVGGGGVRQFGEEVLVPVAEGAQAFGVEQVLEFAVEVGELWQSF